MTSISSDVCETKERRDVSSQTAAAAAAEELYISQREETDMEEKTTKPQNT